MADLLLIPEAAWHEAERRAEVVRPLAEQGRGRATWSRPPQLCSASHARRFTVMSTRTVFCSRMAKSYSAESEHDRLPFRSR